MAEIRVNATGALKLYDNDDSHFVGLQAGSVSSNVTFTLPTADGSNGQFLKTDGSGALSFGSVSSSGAYDLNGGELVLDADADTSITADTDDQIDIRIAGADDFTFTANSFNVLSGSEIDLADNCELRIGDSDDLKLFHQGSHSVIAHGGTGDLQIRATDSGKNFIIYDHDASNEWFKIDASGNAVFNEGSADVDFRVEGNGEANLFYIDGGEDKIYSGISSKSVHAAGYEPHIQIEGTGDNKNSVSLTQNSNNNGAPSLIMCKTRGTAVGATTIVQDDDYLGNIMFGGADGNDRQTYGAHIIARIEGTPGENDMPTELKFGTTADGAASPTDRMRITNSGCLKASTSSYTEASAGDFHELNNTTGNLILRMQNSNASPYGNVIAFSAAAPDNNSNYFFKCFDNVATRVNIFADGDIQNHDNSYGSTSDVKLKEQISDASSQWDDIKNLRVRKFKLKDDISSKGDSNELWRIGLIAQEAETVSPNLVKDNPDLDQLTNEPTGTTTKAIKYSILYMKAVKALQEAMAKIETLETEMTALKARVKTLEDA